MVYNNNNANLFYLLTLASKFVSTGFIWTGKIFCPTEHCITNKSYLWHFRRNKKDFTTVFIDNASRYEKISKKAG